MARLLFDMDLKRQLKSLLAILAGVFTIGLLTPAQLFAADEGASAPPISRLELTVWGIALFSSLVALFFAHRFYKWMMAQDEGNEDMVRIAGYVRDGSSAYLRQQYKVVFYFFLIIFALLFVAAFMLNVQSKFVPFAFITGGFFSGLAGFFGMKTATWASSRTAAGAQRSLNAGLQVAFRSGAVMGLTVVGLGLLDITIWYAILRFCFQDISLAEITVTMLCFGMGASSQALFARVGGGIFTKAADVGADLVGKVEHGIPEDDARNPATIADNVGDNVGDVAGMGADLYESYCGSILATAALGVAAFTHDPEKQIAALFLPMLIAGVGIFLSIAGIYLVKSKEDATQKSLLKALAKGINISSLLVVVAALVCTHFLLPDHMGIAFSVSVGLLAGWLIGKWTEYVTSDEYQPTRTLAAQTVTGPATVIIGGIASGMKSVWVPVLVVCVSILCAFGGATNFNFADVEVFTLGLYGVGIAAVGMLSTLGITLATDAYGPIADNAGGNAQMAGLEPIVRERTDALDSLGNTTAATGKGFAIGSAALTALALMAAYVEEVRIGFDRWAEDETVISAEADPGYYKINEQLVMLKREGKKTSAWLLFPGEIRIDSWRTDSDSGGVPLNTQDRFADEDGVGEGAGKGLTINGQDVNRTIEFTNGKEISLVEAKGATLPDYARYYDASLMNPKILVGIFIGCMATFVFCALTMEAVGRAAQGMVNEVRRQFKENPGIMDGSVIPDYAAPVTISTKAAQKEMILPSLLGLGVPIVTGLVLGVGGVLGLLVGAMTCGFCVAVFMANAGGSWDNAKKYIEAGNLGGKGSDAHKASVVGDTVGDPFKDTSGPSLNILIKLMSMVSVVMAGLVVRYSLMAMGIF
jgi:inorganic pyrophosphatase/K(+)-stimulated pyrophosphate-energized sodium pump